MQEMDKDLVKLAEDDLQSIVEKRTEQDVGSDKFNNLTEAIDKSEDKLIKAYKVTFDHQEKIREIESNEALKKAELDQKNEQFLKEIELKSKLQEMELKNQAAEIEMKKAQFDAEIKFKYEELRTKNEEFKEEMNFRTKQHKEELKQRTNGEFIKGGFIVAGALVTGTLTFALQVVLKNMDFDNQKFWVPELMEFNKFDRFTYPFAQAMERQINKLS